jgi:hypothetical protein
MAKNVFVHKLQHLLGTRRLHVAGSCAKRKRWPMSWGTFTVKVTPVGNKSFESVRKLDHDGLLLAVAPVACRAETLSKKSLIRQR